MGVAALAALCTSLLKKSARGGLVYRKVVSHSLYTPFTKELGKIPNRSDQITSDKCLHPIFLHEKIPSIANSVSGANFHRLPGTP